MMMKHQKHDDKDDGRSYKSSVTRLLWLSLTLISCVFCHSYGPIEEKREALTVNVSIPSSLWQSLNDKDGNKNVTLPMNLAIIMQDKGKSEAEKNCTINLKEGGLEPPEDASPLLLNDVQVRDEASQQDSALGGSPLDNEWTTTTSVTSYGYPLAKNPWRWSNAALEEEQEVPVTVPLRDKDLYGGEFLKDSMVPSKDPSQPEEAMLAEADPPMKTLKRQTSMPPKCALEDYDWENKRKIGKGGQATAFLVRGLRDGGEYIYKEYRKSLEYQRELAIQTSMPTHPNIIALTCVRPEVNGVLMPYLGGGDLWQNGLPVAATSRQLALYSAQLVAAVEAMHRAGFLHHDIKPQNLVRASKDDHIKLIDFGLAVAFADVNYGRGTKITMAPEVARVVGYENAPLHEALDWWSVGATIYMLHTLSRVPVYRRRPGSKYIPYRITMNRKRGPKESVVHVVDDDALDVVKRSKHGQVAGMEEESRPSGGAGLLAAVTDLVQGALATFRRTEAPKADEAMAEASVEAPLNEASVEAPLKAPLNSEVPLKAEACPSVNVTANANDRFGGEKGHSQSPSPHDFVIFMAQPKELEEKSFMANACQKEDVIEEEEEDESIHVHPQAHLWGAKQHLSTADPSYSTISSSKKKKDDKHPDGGVISSEASSLENDGHYDFPRLPSFNTTLRNALKQGLLSEFPNEPIGRRIPEAKRLTSPRAFTNVMTFSPVPDYFSPELKSLLKILMNPDPNLRRFNTNKQLSLLKRHPYFRDVDWNNLPSHSGAPNPPPQDPLVTFEGHVDTLSPQEKLSTPSPSSPFELPALQVVSPV